MKNLKVAIVGCGDISHSYAETIDAYDYLTIVGAYDLDCSRAEKLVNEFGGKVYSSLDDVLEDRQVDMVINLTTQKAHAHITRKCLEAGKHVHSEKPLAMEYLEALALAELAESKGLRLSCSPITYMGEAEQTIWKIIRQGLVGTVRMIYAEANWHRLETFLPNPEPFYEVGAHYDVGVYPLSIITAIFGPAKRVFALSRLLLADHEMPDHRPFRISSPDFNLAFIELANGSFIRLTTNFYVSWFTKQQGIEFHGDAGSLYLSSWERFDAEVEYAPFGEEYTPLPYLKTPYPGIEWARAITETYQAIQVGKPHRASARHAAHIVEILNAINTSSKLGQPIDLKSTFTPPAPMDWAV